jgi:hypothetical protein
MSGPPTKTSPVSDEEERSFKWYVHALFDNIKGHTGTTHATWRICARRRVLLANLQ